jgi:ABC-type sulfate/molybdate transport systems ATPase subunit
MLELKNISLSYDKEILKNISIEILENEIIGIAGRSGAGKSSLLKIISGHLDASEGEVIVNGKQMPLSSQRMIPGNPEVATVNQDFKLDVYHTTTENLREAILNWPTEKREARVVRLLQLFDLQKVSQLKAHQLSGGEQQRLAIARAIAPKPKLLLLDEPFSHLDHRLRNRLTNLILKVKQKEHITVVLVSHDGQELMGLCDKLALLNQGKLSKFLPPIPMYYTIKSKRDAELLGIVNTLAMGDKTIYFRPTEYKISTDGVGVTFEKAMFNGMVYLNHFTSHQGEKIILYAMEPLAEVSHIQIDLKR